MMKFVFESEGVSRNETGLLISRYAKVSHYNRNNSKDVAQFGLHGNGQMPWNHRWLKHNFFK